MKGKLYIIGIGLTPDYLTIKALKILGRVKKVFLDSYTSLLVGDGVKLKEVLGSSYEMLSRRDLEDLNAEKLFKALSEGDVALLSPGDPLIATTHVNIIIEAWRRGYDVEIVPGVSIVSASVSFTGLMIYKLGKIATVTYPKDGIIYEYPYDVVKENSLRNLHTLLLLEVDIDKNIYMSVNEAIQILLGIESLRREGIITPDRLAIGISRLGGEDMRVCPDSLGNLMNMDLGKPPHSLIITAPKLHFIEEEALKVVKDVYCR